MVWLYHGNLLVTTMIVTALLFWKNVFGKSNVGYKRIPEALEFMWNIVFPDSELAFIQNDFGLTTKRSLLLKTIDFSSPFVPVRSFLSRVNIPMWRTVCRSSCLIDPKQRRSLKWIFYSVTYQKILSLYVDLASYTARCDFKLCDVSTID